MKEMVSMQETRWEDRLSVGIELIDNQHKEWINHFNGVVEAVKSDRDARQIARTLDFLVDYTEVHFSTEEGHMAASNYPGLKDHKARHEEFKQTLNNLVQDFEEEGITHLLADSISTLLANWLVKHIETVDMQFGAFVKEKGIVITEDA